MKLLVFYILILVPLPILVGMIDYGMPPVIMISLVFFYALVYRPLVHAWRLIDLKRIRTKKELWRLFIPFSSARYFGDLYLRIH
jgi:hypothetical protein